MNALTRFLLKKKKKGDSLKLKLHIDVRVSNFCESLLLRLSDIHSSISVKESLILK